MPVATITPTVVTTGFSSNPKVAITWPSATPDGAYQDWRVYRRPNGGTDWTLIAIVTPSSTKAWDDYTVPSGDNVQYAVTQTTTTPEEGAKVASSATGVLSNAKYWLVVPSSPSLNMQLFIVTSDTFSDDVETATVNLLGRGRRFEHGDNFGVQGTLTVELNTQPTISARAQRLQLEAIRDSHADVYLRNPFGDVFSAHLMSMQVTRVPGIGTLEHTNVQLGYAEVSA